MEISPTGSTFRMKTRFARFQNGQELLRMWSVFADVKTADDLDLPVPSLEQRDDGSRAPSTVPVQPTVELEHYVASLAERAGKVATRQVRPDEVLGLTFTTKAASELRARIRKALEAAGALDDPGPGGADDEDGEEVLEPTVATYNAYAAGLLTDHGLRIGHEQPAGLALRIRAPGVAAAVHRGAGGLAIRGVAPRLRALLTHRRGDGRSHPDGDGQTAERLQQAATSDRPRRCGPLGALLEPTALLLCCQLARLSPGSRFGARLLRAVHDPRTTGRRAGSSVSRPHSDQEPS